MKSSGQDPLDNPQQQAFELRARKLWREAARQIDPVTAGRLRAARREALQAAHTRVPHTSRWLLPTGATAAIALAAMLVWQPLPHAPPSLQANQTISATAEADNELPPGAEQADPTLYQNLDFYAWLAANDNQGATR